MENKKTLLYFCSDFAIGLSAMMIDQLIAIKKAGINVIAIGGDTEQEKGLSEFASKNGVDIIRIKGLDKHENFNMLTSTISEIVKSNNVDIIHVQNNWQLTLVGIMKFKLARKNRPKVIYTVHAFRHNHPIKSKIAQLMIGGALFLFADHIICMTDYVKNKFKVLTYKIKKIPLGVKDNYFTETFNCPNVDSLKIIFPAQFRTGKNQDLIIRAFYEFIKVSKDKHAKLILPGNGDLLNAMKSLTRELGIENQVIFTGFVPKDIVKNLYLESNVAIVASNSETFGQSIVEPFVLGRCVVSTPVGIAPEIIKKDKNGFIFNTKEDLTKILIKLNENKDALRTIGLNNYNLRDQFNWKNVTEIYKNIFNL